MGSICADRASIRSFGHVAGAGKHVTSASARKRVTSNKPSHD